MTNHQRIGSPSNAHVGEAFEKAAARALAKEGVQVAPGYGLEVGIGARRKRHRFDLGADSPAVIVECKSHRWTTTGNMPSAKMTVWNEAMLYFACAPVTYRKILFVLRDIRSTNGEALADYYVRTHGHLIPTGVEIWEYDEQSPNVRKIVGA